jgi:ATP-dependent Lon protease
VTFFQVIKESAELALSWVKTHLYDLGITMIDVHLHLPAGAQKKDGPSAGVAVVRSLNFFFLRFWFLKGVFGRSARWYHS